MNVTRTFDETAKAYAAGYRTIINRGGTRSGKSFATLQLIFLIATQSKKHRLITCVSHSFPHLEMGIVRDFDTILLMNNINPDSVRTKRPYIYKLGNSTIEFISVDNIGKSLGAARDILFANECNKIKHNIIHQLAVRTKEAVFYDFNPDSLFWLYEHEYHLEKDSIEIVSTYIDNKDNLTEAQLKDIQKAKGKADKEKEEGKSGYWSHWWQVYGRGEIGRMVDRLVFPNYTTIAEIPDNFNLMCYGLDFGFSTDPTAVAAIYWDGLDNIIVDEMIYQTDLINVKNDDSPNKSIQECLDELKIDNDKFIVAESAEPKSIRELRYVGFNIYAVKKSPIMDGLKQMHQYNMAITERSKHLISEFDGYMYPIDKDDKIIPTNPIGADHLIDAVRYALLMKGRLW